MVGAVQRGLYEAMKTWYKLISGQMPMDGRGRGVEGVVCRKSEDTMKARLAPSESTTPTDDERAVAGNVSMGHQFLCAER